MWFVNGVRQWGARMAGWSPGYAQKQLDDCDSIRPLTALTRDCHWGGTGVLRLHERASLHRGGSPLTMPAFRAALAERHALPEMGATSAAALSQPPQPQQYAPSHRPPRMRVPAGAMANAGARVQHTRPDIRWDSGGATARGHQWARRVPSAAPPGTGGGGMPAREMQ